MTPPFEELAGLDKLVHEPARLAILTTLTTCQSADFLFLQRLIGLTKGNLGAHLAKLESAGLVEATKTFAAGKVPHTSIALTAAGHEAVTRHWDSLARLRNAALSRPPASPAAPS